MKPEQEQLVEKNLMQAFQPVRPSREFVQRLRQRIVVPQPQLIVENLERSRRSAVLAIGGVLSASLLILTVARVVYYLLGRSRHA